MNKLLCILILCLSLVCCTNSTSNEEKKQLADESMESYTDSAKVSTQMLDSIKHFLKLGQYDNAKQCMDFYEQQSGIASTEVVAPGYESYYYIKGVYYINVNKPDSAQILFQKCNNNDVDPYIRMLVYGGLSLLYDKKGVADSTAKYALLSYEANESLSQRETEESKKKSDDIITLQWWLLFAIVIINNVSARELRICILARLKFKPGEIATIMDCRFPEVSLTRSRLLKRVYGVEGKAADFDRQLMLLY